MSVRVNWENDEKTLLMVTFKGNWTQSEAEKAMQAGLMMQNMTSSPFEIVMNFLPSDIPPITYASLVKQYVHSYVHPAVLRLTIVDPRLPIPLFKDLVERSGPFANRAYQLAFAETLNLDQAIA